MEFLKIFNQILMLFLLMVAGYAARKIEVFDDKVTKGLSSILLKLTLPALIISSMQNPFSTELLKQSGQILLLSVITYGISIGIAVLVPKLMKSSDEEKSVYQFILLFSNVGFMGYPVVESVFGKEALFYTAIYNLPFNLLVFTLGIYLFTSKGGKDHKVNWKIFVNPGVVAVFIGFFLFIFSIRLPYAIEGAVELLGSTTTPLSMIIVGGLLAKIEVKKVLGNWRVYVTSLVRLIVLPILIWLIFKGFITDPLLLGVPVIIAAMPAAANTAILAEEYGGNAELASQGVFISTLLSVISIPLIAFLIR